MDLPKKDEIQKDEPKELPPTPKKEPAPPEKKPVQAEKSIPAPSKPSVWTRLLRSLLGILILAGLGATAVILALYIPVRQELDRTQREIKTLSEQSTSRLETANLEIERLSAYETTNESLQTQLDHANLRLEVMQIRLDITSAQLALTNEDTAKARLALSKTDASLKKLGAMLPTSQNKIVSDLQARLKLVLGEMDDSAYAALSDLDVMTNILLELENTINRP